MHSPALGECFAVMQTLIEYRHQPISHRLQKIRHKYSMLHPDALTLIYHFAKTCAGHILEIGPYLGGSTIVAALGVRESGEAKTIISIELGGRLVHPRLPTKNILKDLKKNLTKQGVADMITLIEGQSWAAETVTQVRQRLQPGSVGLLIFDADGNVKRDLEIYRDLFAPGCWILVDDYYMPGSGSKGVFIKPQVDALVSAGQLEPLGLYGWGTWVGRWARAKRIPYAASSGVRSTGAQVPSNFG